MANQSSRGQNRPPALPVPAAPAVRPEPEVRRWPHPVACAPESSGLPEALHYIHCSLSYQNQLLSEIRALLEALSPGCGEPEQHQGK